MTSYYKNIKTNKIDSLEWNKMDIKKCGKKYVMSNTKNKPKLIKSLAGDKI